MTRGQPFSGRFDQPTRAILPSDEVVHLHLLRHGEVLAFGERVVRGQIDVEVSETGREQHERLARWFAAHEPPPDLVLCSDLARCRHLGERLAALTGAPLRFVPELREQAMGRWEGHTWVELTQQDPRVVTAYWDDYARARPPGGESLADLSARIATWWDATRRELAGRRAVLVTHGGVIRVLLCQLLGLPVEQALRFSPAAASHTAVLLAAAGAVVNTVGERPWLVAEENGARPRLSSRPRIALSGSAGTGKTTLGRRLAEELGLPFVEEGMRQRLEQGLQLQRYDLDALRLLLEELWAEQRAAEEACTKGFVADRSALDFAAFWIHYGLAHDPGATEQWVARMAEEAQGYDAILLFPWGVLPLREDGVRSTNRWFQLQFQAVLETFVARHLPAERLVRVPDTDDLEVRIAHVRRVLQP